MKRSAWLLLAVAGIALMLLVAFFPASWAWRMARRGNVPLKVGQLHGSVWHGRAVGVSYAGLDLGTLRWRLSPALLWGRVDLDLALQGGLANGHAELTRHGRVVTAHDVHLRVSVGNLPITLGQPPMHPRGTLVVDLARVELRDRWPGQLSGSVTWRDAALADRSDTVSLGDLRADLDERAGSVLQARLSDDGGPLALSGTVEASTLGWRVDAVLRARRPTPLMHHVIAQLGEPSADGSLHIHRRGGLTLENTP